MAGLYLFFPERSGCFIKRVAPFHFNPYLATLFTTYSQTRHIHLIKPDRNENRIRRQAGAL